MYLIPSPSIAVELFNRTGREEDYMDFYGKVANQVFDKGKVHLQLWITARCFVF